MKEQSSVLRQRMIIFCLLLSESVLRGFSVNTHTIIVTNKITFRSIGILYQKMQAIETKLKISPEASLIFIA